MSCPTLTDPDSGFVVTEVIGTKTTATFTCVDGYYLSGSSILTCKTSGSWDKTIPTCSKYSFMMTSHNKVSLVLLYHFILFRTINVP